MEVSDDRIRQQYLRSLTHAHRGPVHGEARSSFLCLRFEFFNPALEAFRTSLTSAADLFISFPVHGFHLPPWAFPCGISSYTALEVRRN